METCKPNAVDPPTYLTATLTAIVNGHKQSRIDELLPWNCPVEEPTAGWSNPGGLGVQIREEAEEMTDFDFDDGPLKMRWNWQHHRTQDAPTDYLCP